LPPLVVAAVAVVLLIVAEQTDSFFEMIRKIFKIQNHIFIH
jgi:hypothetical protein